MATVLCLDLQPFIADLVRRLHPDVEVRTDLTTIEDITGARPAVIIASGSHPLLEPLSHGRLASRVVAVGAGAGDLPPPSHRGPFLTRPLDPDELSAALAPRLSLGLLGRLRARVRQVGSSASSEILLAGLRVGATIAGALLLPSREVSTTGVLATIMAVAIVLARLRVRSLQPRLVAINAGLVTAVIIMSGSAHSPYLLLGAVTAVEVGLVLAPAIAGVLAALATVAGVLDLAFGPGEADLALIVTWGLVFPLCGVIGGLASRLTQSVEVGSRRRMLELNETLTALQRQSAAVGGSLEMSTVAQTIVGEACDGLGAASAMVLLGEPPIMQVAAHAGLSRRVAGRIAVGEPGTPVTADLFVDLMGTERLQVERLSDPSGSNVGWLVAGLPDGNGRELRQGLRGLGSEAGVALANVRMFDRIRDFSVDTERKRLARDLHDGTIQALVHVGFELDLAARTLPEGARDQVRAARTVVGQTVEEVRRTIAGMTSARLHDGLGPALVQLGLQFGGSDVAGPTVVARVAPLPRLVPEAELQLLRVAQEALSNAVQHADATNIDVVADVVDGALILQVNDDGRGLQPGDHQSSAADGRGVGLRAMGERARLLGADFSIISLDPGTGVHLSVPLERVLS